MTALRASNFSVVVIVNMDYNRRGFRAMTFRRSPGNHEQGASVTCPNFRSGLGRNTTSRRSLQVQGRGVLWAMNEDYLAFRTSVAYTTKADWLLRASHGNLACYSVKCNVLRCVIKSRGACSHQMHDMRRLVIYPRISRLDFEKERVS